MSHSYENFWKKPVTWVVAATHHVTSPVDVFFLLSVGCSWRRRWVDGCGRYDAVQSSALAPPFGHTIDLIRLLACCVVYVELIRGLLIFPSSSSSSFALVSLHLIVLAARKVSHFFSLPLVAYLSSLVTFFLFPLRILRSLSLSLSLTRTRRC